MKNILLSIVLVSLLAIISQNQVNPPVWAPHFHQSFIESYKTTSYKVFGETWYDAERKMSRLDRRTGEHEGICSSILPNVTTPCVQLVRDQKRYVYFPQRRQCCYCCDAAHGCGILKRDWLSTAKYVGQETLSDQSFDKWSIPDGDAMDYYWATTDSKQILRKMDEGGSRIKDFIMNTYSQAPIADSVFALPQYCISDCPSTTVCQFFRNNLISSQ